MRTHRHSRGRGGANAPALNLEFLSGSLDSRITATRASNKTYFDAAGVMQTAANNAFPTEYNPSTLAALGVSIWEARTNQIRNNTMQNAVAGTPGTAPTNWTFTTPVDGLTGNIVAVGTERGMEYIDIRYQGTVTAGAVTIAVEQEGSEIIAATIGQVWNQSCYLKLVAGSLANLSAVTLGLIQQDAGGVTNGTQIGADLKGTINSTLTRYDFTATLTNGSGLTAAIRPRVRMVTGAASSVVDFTLRIAVPQLELGAFATPVIKTTTAAATRAVDVLTITGADFTGLYNQIEGTIVTDGQGYQTSTNNALFATISDGTSANRLQAYVTSTNNVGAQLADGAATVFSLTGLAGATVNTRYKMAVAYKTLSSAVAVNGNAPATNAGAIDITEMNQMRIGARQDGIFLLNGWLKSLQYYRTRLSNAQLQAMTL